QGPLALSVNIEKGYEVKSPIREVRLSNHGDWRHQHEIALMSNYGSTPFYDYYIDDILKVLYCDQQTLFGLNEKIRELICRFIGITTKVRYSEHYLENESMEFRDLRNSLHPKKDISIAMPEFEAKPYYQVTGQKQPFMPNLSILDLLFNLGPESIFVLRDSIAK
ncbi:MAG: WbqC family protein, partial [Bacteroidales bacterium]|nr:WbqC family protein [Bacteroidales bacterium]